MKIFNERVCPVCGERVARFTVCAARNKKRKKGVHAKQDHQLCPKCFRAESNRYQVGKKYLRRHH